MGRGGDAYLHFPIILIYHNLIHRLFFFFFLPFPFIRYSLLDAEFYYLNIFSMSRNIIIFNGAILTLKLIEFPV